MDSALRMSETYTRGKTFNNYFSLHSRKSTSLSWFDIRHFKSSEIFCALNLSMVQNWHLIYCSIVINSNTEKLTCVTDYSFSNGLLNANFMLIGKFVTLVSFALLGINVQVYSLEKGSKVHDKTIGPSIWSRQLHGCD